MKRKRSKPINENKDNIVKEGSDAMIRKETEGMKREGKGV